MPAKNEEENKVGVEKRGSKSWRVLKKTGFWVLFLGVPLVLTAPLWLWGLGYVYQWYAHDDLTPSELEVVIQRRPATLRELRVAMSKEYSEYQMDWTDTDAVKSFLEKLERDTASDLEHEMFDMNRAVWCGRGNKASLVKYIYSIETKPISAQVINVGGCKYYACLLDKDCNILGWIYPEE